MLDPQMRHYYQRIYNAKPSPEIARTRRPPPSSQTSNNNAVGGSVGSGVRRRRNSSYQNTSPSKHHATPPHLRRPSSGKPLSKQRRSQSTQDLASFGGPSHHHQSRLPPRNDPGDYWTQRYLERELREGARGYYNPSGEEEDEEQDDEAGYHHGMKAPSRALRASLTELSLRPPPPNNAAPEDGHVSNKIDEFLTVISKAEAEMRDEFEFKLRRMEFAKRRTSSGLGSKWINRSSSQTSLLSGQASHSQPPASSSIIPERRAVRAGAPSSRASKASQRSLSAATRLYGGSSSAAGASRGRSQSPLLRARPSTAARRPPTATARPASSNANTLRRPARGSRPATATHSTVTTAKQVPDYGLPDTSKVGSRLRKDRNYQPPRRKTRGSRDRKKAVHQHQQQEEEDNDYEDDFEEERREEDEDEEDEEDDEERRTMLMTRRWLVDQAERGMARQSALKNGDSAHEKESSKDSAYGFSGGESRLQTREPTPDTLLQQQQQLWQLQNQKKMLRRKQQLRRQQQQQAGSRPLKAQHGTEGGEQASEAARRKSQLFVRLVNDVTGEILQRGVFTDRAVRDVLESHAREHPGVSRREVEVLLGALKKELGIGRSAAGMRGAKSEPSLSLKDLLCDPTACGDKGTAGTASATSAWGQRLLGRGNTKDSYDTLDELSDAELSNILQEVDLDDSAMEEVLGAVKQRAYPVKKAHDALDAPGNLKLFESLNITDLNISFNNKGSLGGAGAGGASERRQQQREQLIKSFAKNHPERPRSGNLKKASTASAPPPTLKGKSHRRQDSSSSNTENNPPEVRISAPARSAKVSSSPPPPVRRKASETPPISSETPRSSSLYHPETEEDERPPPPKKKDDSDISEDCDNAAEEAYTSVSENEEVDEEIESESE